MFYIVSILAFFALSSLPGQAQTISSKTRPVEQFKSAFAHMAQAAPTDKEWLATQSPWRPYFEKQFYEGLIPEQLERSLAAQRHGQCEIVISEEMRGFLALYPALEAIFTVEEIRQNFETVLLPQFSFALQRCQIFKTIIPIIEQNKRKWVLDELAYGGFPLFKIGKYVPLQKIPPITAHSDAVNKEVDPTISLEQAMRGLYHLALCQLYQPAIDDIARLTPEIGWPKLVAEELLWLETKLEDPLAKETIKPVIKQHIIWAKEDRNYRKATAPQPIITTKTLLRRPISIGLSCGEVYDPFSNTKSDFGKPVKW